MLYQMHELNHLGLAPVRATLDAVGGFFRSPFVPWSYTPVGRAIAAGCEVAERITRRYGKPAFGLDFTVIDGKEVPVHETEVLSHRFCTLLHFRRETTRRDPKVLVVAPLSGHYATLLRGTVEAMLPDYDVYLTDWTSAQDVPAWAGSFDLDDYIDYVREFLTMLGPDVHVLAICQPAVPVLAAVALMAEDNDPHQPRTMTLMGGPIDTRRNPTEVNKFAEGKTIAWFERTVITHVPVNYAGFMRRVYPGFLQLGGFMSLNLDRHVDAHLDLFNHLVEGDGDNAAAHREFYDEYLSVMDLPAEYYLQTLKTVFIDHDLPRGAMKWRGRTINPAAIRKTALLTVEGEKDDISGIGQTEAAHDLCTSLPADLHLHHVQKGVGHYGIFNGRRWRTKILPVIGKFIHQHG